MEVIEARLWKVLRPCACWTVAAVVAVYVAAGISTVQEELTGVRPEELVSEMYSWLIYGRSRETSELERALEAMKEPNQSAYRPRDLWGKQMPPEGPLRLGKAFPGADQRDRSSSR